MDFDDMDAVFSLVFLLISGKVSTNSVKECLPCFDLQIMMPPNASITSLQKANPIPMVSLVVVKKGSKI
jgi:hypothetical protein